MCQLLALLDEAWGKIESAKPDLRIVKPVEISSSHDEVPSRPAKTWARQLGQSAAIAPDKKAG